MAKYDVVVVDPPADTPALPCPSANLSLRISGLQSFTTHPASAGSVKYRTSSTNPTLPNSSRIAASGEGWPSLPEARGGLRISAKRGTE